MPQPVLPLFSADMTVINGRIAVQQIDDTVYRFQGSIPVFRHHVRDEELFRSFCCQLINLGNATASELSKSLQVNHEKLSRRARLERTSTDSVKSSTRIKKKRAAS